MKRLLPLLLAAAAGACAHPAHSPLRTHLTQEAVMMDLEQNRALFRRFTERIVNEGDLGAADELLAPDFVTHEELPPGIPSGPEGVKQLFQMMRTGFPDLRMSIEDMVAEQDRVVARLTFRGTHRGEFMGMPATGRPVEYQAIDIMRVHEGKLAEHWGVSDMMGLMQQLGAVPPQP